MCSSLRIAALAAAAVVCVPPAAAQNPVQENDIQFDNGTDVVFLFSDPSVGSDLFWKAHPAGALKSPVPAATPAMQLVGFEYQLFDTDWNTPPIIYDVLISTGQVGTSGPLAGVITPNFADPAAVLIAGGPAAFPPPCAVSPALCTSGGCPVPGYVTGYFVDAALLGPCDGSGSGAILLAKDNHYCATLFLPPGMTFMSGPPGSCGLGDYSLMDAHSTDETQGDALGNGNSQFGGYQVGGAGMSPEPITEISTFSFQFCEPTISAYIGTDPTDVSVSLPGGLKHLTGTAGAVADVSATGGTTIRFVVYDEDGLPVGSTVCFASTAIAPLLPNPGLGVLGAQLLLDHNDPTVVANLSSGSVALDSQGGVPFDNGIFQSGPKPLPASAGGLGITLHSQALLLRLSTFTLTQTQAFDTLLL